MAILVIPTLLVLSGPAAAQKKKKDADKDAEKNSEKMIKAGVLTGKVMNVYEDKRKIRLQLNIPIPKINVGAVQGIQNAQRAVAQAQYQKNWNALQNARRQLMLAQMQPTVTYTWQTQDIELGVLDEVVVRRASPPQEFDEKGRVKKLTKADLKELKGPDPKAFGYKAEFSDVSTEQVLQVTLVKKKGAPPKPMPRPKKGKGKDGDAEMVDVLGENEPQISHIVIIGEPPPGKG
jgi:hypothetical protein